MKENLIEKAVTVAIEAHWYQKRKGDDLPYIIHPLMVALKLIRHNFPDKVIAAALTHDVLEDTDYPEARLREELGDDVLNIVKTVTNDQSLPWEEKKKKYVASVRKGSEAAKAVAVADKIHNLESLLLAYEEQGPALWKRFNRGKDKKIWFEKAVLQMLKDTWRHPLIEEYERLLTKVMRLNAKRRPVVKLMSKMLTPAEIEQRQRSQQEANAYFQKAFSEKKKK